MSSCSEADIKPFSGRDYTCVTFKPDLTKFGMERLDKDIVALMTRRAYDVAGASNGVKVYLNGKLLPVRQLKDLHSIRNHLKLCWLFRSVHSVTILIST